MPGDEATLVELDDGRVDGVGERLVAEVVEDDVGDALVGDALVAGALAGARLRGRADGGLLLAGALLRLLVEPGRGASGRVPAAGASATGVVASPCT